MIDTEKIYLNPGNVVMVRHNIDNKPKMLVLEKVSHTILNRDGMKENSFAGIRCGWFDKNQTYQTAVFSTKDLELVD